MSLFGVQSSEQRNIINNNMRSSVSNSNSNVSKNVMADSNTAYSSAKLVNEVGGEILCTPALDSSIDQDTKSNISLYSQTNTHFDTGLTTDITNDLKNKAKITTPSLGAAGLMSSQVNNQINRATNNVQNSIANNIYTNRTNIASLKQDGTGTAELINRGKIVCPPGKPTLHVDSTIVQKLQNDFISNTFDEAVATSRISTTLMNKFRNTVEMKGSPWYAVVGGVVMLGAIVYIWRKKREPSDEGTIHVIAPVLIFLVIIWVGGVWFVVHDEEYHEWDTSDINCEDEYTLEDGFKGAKAELCLNKSAEAAKWGESINDTATFAATYNSEGVWSGTSVRGTIIEENGLTAQYARLNYDPYSPYDCTVDVKLLSAADTVTHTEKCRSIEEDYEWEQALRSACGCCGCAPEKIGYDDEKSTYDNCKLDNSRQLGRHCDTSISIIQPGVGYKTGGPYKTTCRNIVDDELVMCKKNDGDDIVDLDDDDPANITVKLISQTDCHGKNPDAQKCYKAAIQSEDAVWSDIRASMFGEASSEPCDGIPGPLGCPSDSDDDQRGCVKADSCRIDYLKAMDIEIDRATAAQEDVDDIEHDSHCPSDTCIYKIHGVQEIMIEDVPETHISSPNNIYTIVRHHNDSRYESAEDDMKDFRDRSLSPTIESVWRASSLIHSSNGADEDYELAKYAEMSRGPPSAEDGSRTYCTLAKRGPQLDNNLCDCKFRRLPSCIRDKEDQPLLSGCSDEAGQPREDIEDIHCMPCKREDGNVAGFKCGEDVEDSCKKIKKEVLRNIGVSLALLLIFFLAFFLRFFSSPSAASPSSAGAGAAGAAS